MAFRRSTVRLRSAPLMMLRAMFEIRATRRWRIALVAALLWVGLSMVPGCSGERQPTSYSSPTGIERPALPMDEEETAADKAGEVGVVLLVVGGALALLVAPLLFL